MSKETFWGYPALKAGEFGLRLGWAALQLPQASVALQPQLLNQVEGRILMAQVPPIPWKPIQIPECQVVFDVDSFYFVKGPIPESQRTQRLPDRSGSTVEYNPGDRYAGPATGKVVDLIIADSLPIRTVSDQFGRGIWQDATGTQFNTIELTGPNNVQAPGGAPSFSVDVIDPDEGEKNRFNLECNTGRLQQIRRWIFRGNNAQVVPTPQVDGTPRPVPNPAVSPAASPSPAATEKVANLPPQYPFPARRAVINVREISEAITVAQAEQAKNNATPTPNQTVVAAETRAAKAEATAAVAVAIQTAYVKGQEDALRPPAPGAPPTASGGGFEIGDIINGLRDNLGLIAVGVGTVVLGFLVFQAIQMLRRERRPGAERDEAEEIVRPRRPAALPQPAPPAPVPPGAETPDPETDRDDD